jgi:hypothetical protein
MNREDIEAKIAELAGALDGAQSTMKQTHAALEREVARVNRLVGGINALKGMLADAPETVEGDE